MQTFTFKTPTSLNEACDLLQTYGSKARILAGGSDLMGCLKDALWMEYPEHIINIKNIPELSGICITEQGLEIGAATTLSTIEKNKDIQKKWTALAQAARRTASPILRNLGTIGGNLCQENRCWYYRYPEKLGGRIECMRKGGTRCFAAAGDHRYHSIFGAVNKCFAINPSDTAPAVIALKGHIVTTKRTIPAEEFFSAALGAQATVLEHDEILIKIIFANPDSGTQSAFQKIAHRKSIDFALVNCAASLTITKGVIKAASICLNGVYNNPLPALEAATFLLGKKSSEALFIEAGQMALEKARPLLSNGYKVNLAKIIIADCLASCIHP